MSRAAWQRRAGGQSLALAEQGLRCEPLCLLYGCVKRGAVSLSAALKLLDHESGQLAAVFFGGDDTTHYHAARLRIAAEATRELPGGRAVALAPGVCLSLLYRHRLSRRLAMRAADLLEVAGYSPVLATFSPREPTVTQRYTLPRMS